MTSSAREVLEVVLEDGEFIKDGRRSPGLIDEDNVATSVNTDLRYGSLLRGNSENASVDLVYEVPSQINGIPGNPSIYFKYFNHQPSVNTVKELRTLIWNQGRVPTLWIVTDDTISIYDCFARPTDAEREDSCLLSKLSIIGEGLKKLKEEKAFHKGSFDNGDFWKSLYGQRIQRSQRVDISMLADLSKTIEILTTPNFPIPATTLKTSVAHSLLGRTIFVSYLQDRAILSQSFFQSHYRCDSFNDLLKSKESTYSFFDWLRQTFNGNLFPISAEERETVNDGHLSIIQQFLSGTDMSSYPNLQYRLWPYRFNIIPIELISSIYEMFAHNRDSNIAEVISVHYTRLPLVEMMLSLAMRDMHHSARVLDPACGSGVFLVESFRRLAWLKAKSKEDNEPLQREELHEILCNQIFGMDIDPGAVDVAAFSLYLTLLELDPDPQPPSALKFPYLLPNSSLEAQAPNLYVQDFFNLEHTYNKNIPFDRGFDLIVGNPPWTALEKKTAPYDPENPENGHQWGLEYCKENKILDCKPDQAFMLRACDFTKKDTLIAFIVCSRLFYQQDRSWLDTFLEKNTLEVVINFSDLVAENILFGGQSSTRLPASAILFRANTPTQKNKVKYITPKWSPNVSKQQEILVTSEDVRYLSQTLLRQKPFLWKSAFRGVSRDYRLLNRLQNLPSLEHTLSDAGVKKDAHRGITFGKGSQKKAPQLQGKPFLSSGLASRYVISVNKASIFDRPTVALKSNTSYLQLPALVISRSLKEDKVRVAVVEPTNDRTELIIDQAYYGVPNSKTYPHLIYRLNAVLNSNLAFYMAFMFSSSLGWDRRLIETGDWLQVRLPATILSEEHKQWEEIMSLEHWLRENKETKYSFKDSIAAEIKLEQLVYQLYEITSQEKILVEDTLRYSIMPFLSRRKNGYLFDELAMPSLDELKIYVKRLNIQLNGVLNYSNLKIISRIFIFKLNTPVCVCQFRQKEINEHCSDVEIVEVSEIDEILHLISSSLRTKIADNLIMQRNIRIYDEQDIWLIKPAEKRLWSEAMALSDADTIVREHMEA